MAEINIKTTDITGADQQVVTSDNVEYCGFSFRETSGTNPAVVKVHNGTDNTGKILDTVRLAAGESAREFYEIGIESDGVFIDIVSGTIEGSVRWRA